MQAGDRVWTWAMAGDQVVSIEVTVLWSEPDAVGACAMTIDGAGVRRYRQLRHLRSRLDDGASVAAGATVGVEYSDGHPVAVVGGDVLPVR